MIRYIGLLLGIVGGLTTAAWIPDSFVQSDGQVLQLGRQGQWVGGLATTMAIWWMFEAIPVYATALLPVVVLPLGGVLPFDQAATPYADDLIFLFLGGFVLALAMQRCGLHRRIALLTLRCFGTRPPSIVAGFMLITATLSMWVSNTATTMMMLPIAVSLLELVDARADRSLEVRSQFSLCLVLAIAYAASIGGLGTLIGSPPNGLVASFAEQQLGTPIGFAQWMQFGLPLVVVLLPLTWLALVKLLFRLPSNPIQGGANYLETEWEKLGATRPAEWLVFLIFIATAFTWIGRPWLQSLSWGQTQPLAGLSDAGIALVAALSLFALPNGGDRSDRLMDWETMKELPWGLLILFGGGLSLAAAIEQTGLSSLLGSGVASLDGWSDWVVTLAVIVLIVFLTEITSNTATVAAMLPILAAVAGGLDMSPLMLLIPAALAGSCAFMLPVATPPNAIVFGTGRVTIRQMASTGLLLNVICIVVLVLFAQWF